MAGVMNDYLIYPVLDLVRDEIRKSGIKSGSGEFTFDPFSGEPNVNLFRSHPLDSDRLTGANLVYESKYVIDIQLTFGSTDPTTFPVEVDSEHPDWDFLVNWRLTQVTTVALNPQGDPLVTTLISLNYDGNGLLTGTSISRI